MRQLPQKVLDLVKNKKVFITGASSGIGEQLAYQYAKAQADVFLTARREPLLKKVAEKCLSLGSPRAKFKTGDMSNLHEIRSIVEAGVTDLGGIDHLLLVHAFMPFYRPWGPTQSRFDDLERALTVNVQSTIHTASYALEHLQRSNGSIGLVNSIEGKLPVPYDNVYGCTKAATDAFFSAFRQELKLRKMNVSITNCVVGAVDTEYWRNTVHDMEKHLNVDAEAVMKAWPMSKSEDVAQDILVGTTKRTREIYVGKFTKTVTLLRDWLPNLFAVKLPLKNN